MSGRYIVVRNGDLLVGGDDTQSWFPTVEILAHFDGHEAAHAIGLADSEPLWAIGVDAERDAPEGYRFVHLRSLFPVVPETDWYLAGRAVQIVEWSRTHRFCGRCGESAELAHGERAMRCPKCALLSFPRLSPAVIMLVHRGEEVLLAHGRAFPHPMYSALAGFVEPGESLEEAVRREIYEEVGVRVNHPRYFGSQPWPFPNSLMLGFFAEWESGEINIDPIEIVDAQWFSIENMPMIPGNMSIASKLVAAHVANHRG